MTARPGHLARSANGTLMARGPFAGCAGGLSEVSSTPLTWDYTLERAKGIEPSWPAWKAGALPLSYARTRPASSAEHPRAGRASHG
jgi:hypothetical protein